MAALATVSGPLLWWSGSQLHRSIPTSDLQQMELWLATGCAVLGAVLGLWWGVALVGVILSVLGTALRRPRLSRWGSALSPAFLRRLVAALLGVQVLVAPASWAAPASDVSTLAAQSSVDLPPATGIPSPAFPQVSGTTAPSPGWGEETPQPAILAPSPSPAWQPRAPEPSMATTGDRVLVEQRTVTVRPRDCLWDIAAEELGPHATAREIDRRWRQWHHTNQDVIGANPHRLLPGMVLIAPAWT